jgi:hypothetical protein
MQTYCRFYRNHGAPRTQGQFGTEDVKSVNARYDEKLYYRLFLSSIANSILKCMFQFRSDVEESQPFPHYANFLPMLCQHAAWLSLLFNEAAI